MRNDDVARYEAGHDDRERLDGTLRGIVSSFVLIGALAVTLAGCQQSQPPAPANTPTPVHAIVARRQTIYPTESLAGVIAPYRNIGISSSLAEPVAEVDVRDGDRVRAGQVLARLVVDDLEASLSSAQRVAAADSARTSASASSAQLAFAQDSGQISNARAALAQALATLAGARRDLGRAQVLANNGYLAQQTVDQERTAVVNDQQAVAAAQASLENTLQNQHLNGTLRAGLQGANVAASLAQQRAAEADVDQIDREIARATIVAPVDGEIVNVNVEPGEYPSGRQLFTLQANDQVYAILSASGLEAFRIEPGAGAVVRVIGDDARFPGTVSAVLDQVTPGSTNFAIKVVVPNAAHRLHAGLAVASDVALPPVTGTAIPLSAFANDLRTSVLVVARGSVKTANVRAKSDDGKTAIVSGLAAGTQVIVDGTTSVSAGDKVAAH